MKKILLIEDDKTLRENTAIFLRRAGFEVETARDGEKGIQKVLEFFPSLIICDIMMPRMNGYKLFEILQTNPSTAIIPFINLATAPETAPAAHETAPAAHETAPALVQALASCKSYSVRS